MVEMEATLGAATIAAFAVYWLGVRSPSPPAPAEFALRRLTDGAALTRNAVISPDGKLVAYDQDGDIWVQQVDTDSAIRLTDDPADDTDPTFSADGAQIAFRSDREGGGIYVVPSLGGAARELAPEARFPSYSPDGRWLIYWMGGPSLDKLGGKLFVRPVSDGPAVPVGAETSVQCAAVWSPDSSRILFQADCTDPIGTVWVYTVGGKELKRNRDLHSVEDEIDQWIANPPRLLVRKRVADAYEVTAVPISADGTRVTGAPQKLTSVTDQLLGVSASLDGRMVLSVSSAKSHLWGLPIDATGKAAGDVRQITEGSYDEYDPALSRDGGEMAFLSSRANGQRVFYRNLATGRAKELSPEGHLYLGAVFTPDGKGVLSAYDGLLVYLPISGGLTKTIWENRQRGGGIAVPYSVWPWDLSPDGKTLLFFTGGRGSGIRNGVVRQLDLASGSAMTLLDDPDFDLWNAHFSYNGRWVVFNATPHDRTSSRIYVAPFRRAPVPRSEWIPVTQVDWDDKPRFSSDDKQIFFVSGVPGRPQRFWAQKLNSDMLPDGKPVAVYSPTHGGSVTQSDNISVGPHLIVFSQTESTGNIWLAEPVKKAAH